MSTAIYKVSDGSTITFKTRGPELYAVLSTPSGQVINGPSRMGNTEEKAAREAAISEVIIKLKPKVKVKNCFETNTISQTKEC